MKKAVKDKWPAQKRVVPIGLGERGWQAYEPYKKGQDGPDGRDGDSMYMYWDSVRDLFFEKGNRWSAVTQQLKQLYPEIKDDEVISLRDEVEYYIDQHNVQIKSNEKGISVNDALQHYMANPGDDGKPAYFDSSSKMVEFENGKQYTFDELVLKYRDDLLIKKSDYGFMDGPTDLGKRPKGDFPTVTWMPRGNEDMDVDPNLTTANKKKAELDLSNEPVIEQLVLDYLEKIPYDTWFEMFNETEMARLRAEFSEHNTYLNENTVEKHFENLTEADWADLYETEMVQILKEELRMAETVEDLEERYPGLGNLYVERMQPQVQSKKAEEEPKKKEEPPQLTNKMMTDMIPMLIEEGEPTHHSCGNCNMRYTDKEGVQRCTVVEGKIDYKKGTCNYMAAGKEASEEDSVDMKMSYDTAGYVETDKKIQCATCKYYDAPNEYCKLWQGKIKPEGCCMAWDRDDVTVPKAETKKSALEHPLSQEEQDEIASTYGPEYNSAALHYYQAVQNGHPNDRALDYAVEEMHKQNIHIDISKFLQIKDTYLKGKVPKSKEEKKYVEKN